jgi:shikimate dehydrogenase
MILEFFGLIGEKLGHSLSEVIHLRLFELLSLPAAYKLMEIPKDRIQEVGQALRLLSFRGINVTIPYKEMILPQLDELDVSARDLMAVNTIKNTAGKLTGYNTDVYGLKEMLAFHHIDPTGKAAVVLGSGGAAKASLQALHELGAARLYVASRSPEGKTSHLPNTSFIGYDDLERISGLLLLNATPVGMWPHADASPVKESIVNRFDAVVDTIYNPWETRLLAMARSLNKPCCNGLYMLVAQAVRAEEIFWEKSIPKEITNTIYGELYDRLSR